MAFINQEMKKRIAPGVKAVLAKYNMKGTMKIRDHMVLSVTIKSGEIDMMKNCDYQRDHMQVNPYWIADNFETVAASFLIELKAAMEGPEGFDESDFQTDYHHRSHYLEINAGTYKKPYVYTPAEEKA